MAERTYIRSSRAHWAQANEIGPGRRTPEEFILSYDDPQIELIIKYHDFSKYNLQRELCAQVTIFDESWQAFTLWHDLWLAFAKESDAAGGMRESFTCPPDRVESILRQHGFKDVTPYENPHKPVEPPAVDRSAEIEAICMAWWPNNWPNVPNAQGERDRAELAAIVAENRRSS